MEKNFFLTREEEERRIFRVYIDFNPSPSFVSIFATKKQDRGVINEGWKKERVDSYGIEETKDGKRGIDGALTRLHYVLHRDRERGRRRTELESVSLGACVWRNKKENGEEPWRLEVEGFEGRGQRKIRLMQASKLNVTSDDNATKPANNSPLGIVIYLVGVERCCVV